MSKIHNTHPHPWSCRLGLAFLAVGLLLAAAIPAAAVTEHQIVFLIDQSGSMSRMHGPGDSWAPNDPPPTPHRTGAVLQTFDELRAHLEQERDPDLVFRLQVVEFGVTAIVRSEVEMRYDPAVPDLLDQARNQLKNILRLPPPGDEQTHTLAGFEAVEQLLGTAPPERTHVVLVTDGKPYAEQSGTNIANGNRYRLSLQNTSEAVSRAGSLDVLGIIGREERQQYWPEWEPFWDQVSGQRAEGVRTAPEVSTSVRDISRRWLGLAPAEEAGRPFHCPPYLEALAFSVVKKRPGETIDIQDALGRNIESSMPGVRVVREATYDRLTIENPAPGLWQFSGEPFSVTVTPAYRQVQRLEPRGAVNVDLPVDFRFQVLAVGGQPFQELPTYPVTAELEIKENDGKNSTLRLNNEGGGVFASDPFTFKAHGSADLLFRGTAPVNAQATEVFRFTDALMVENRELLVLDVGTTLGPDRALRFGGAKIAPALTVRRYSGGGAPLRWQEVSPRPESLLKMSLVRSTEAPPKVDDQERWVPLALEEGGTLNAAIDFRAPVLSWDWFLRRPQQFFVLFQVDSQALRDEYAVREVAREADPAAPAGFDRQAALPALMADPLALPILLQEPWGSYLLTLLALLVAVGVGGWLLFQIFLRLLCGLSDRLRKQRVKVVIHEAGGTDLDGVSKDLTGRLGRTFRKGAVGITIGEDYDNPDWRPSWLKLTRLVRPWRKGVHVAVHYPVGHGKALKKYTTILREAEPKRPLRGMEKAEAYLEIHRKGEIILPGHRR